MEERLPWWRWAFEVALSGFRSGFWLFRRNGMVKVAPETSAKAFVPEFESSFEPWNRIEPENKESEVESSAEDPAKAEIEIDESIAETSAADEDPEPEFALSGLEEPAELVAPEEEIALTNASPQPDESATRPAQEGATAPAPAAKSASPQDPAPTLPFDPPLTAEAPTPEPTTAEKVAAALKARGVDAEQSPFSVFVGQVYDGPLDLLLDLIRKQDIDIYDIPIAKITEQYLKYVETMKGFDVDVAAEFIYTASLLIHIKSKMLLPRDPAGPAEEDDPRLELVNRLLEHERFKTAAQMLLQKQQIEEAVWSNPALKEFRDAEGTEPEMVADVVDLVKTFQQILDRARKRPSFDVDEESVTVSQMIDFVRRRLALEDRPVRLKQLLRSLRSRSALVCAFLAILELIRLQAVLARQDNVFGEIMLKKHTNFDALMAESQTVKDDWK